MKKNSKRGRPPGLAATASPAVREVRQARALTQERFAREMGCSIHSVMRWERLGVLPTDSMLLAKLRTMARTVGVEVTT